MDSARFEHRSRRRVEFADTDMAGICHFARFFVFMETAEHEFLRSLGAEVQFRRDGRTLGWPRAAASCEYLGPARLGDDLDIHLEVARKGRRSLTFAFTLTVGERLVARGRVSTICCRLDGPDGLEAVAIPDNVAARIAEAPRRDDG
jgi:4-hydroxybenzoyl-CoA thioesterase/acyl-CoA thioester hydrolase